MWTDGMMTELKTLTELKDEIGLEGIFGDTGLDTVTQGDIFDWFQFRKVCDNTKFVAFFQRQLKLYKNQYEQYLRIETVKFDPMVADYMERQIIRTGTRSDVGKETSEGETTGNRTTESTTSENGSDNRTLDLTDATETTTIGTGNIQQEGTDNTTVDQTIKATGTNTIERTDGGTTDTTGGTNSRSLNSTTPQSAVYSGVFPEQLDWTYLSEQNEQKSENTAKETRSNNSNETTTRDLTDTTDGSTELTINRTTTTNDTNSVDGTTKHTGTDNTVRTSSGTNNVTDESTNTTTGSKSSELTSDTSDDMRERYTGRHESPQDLMDRARDFILRTNAFSWFINKLEPCFLGVYEM